MDNQASQKLIQAIYSELAKQPQLSLCSISENVELPEQGVLNFLQVLIGKGLNIRLKDNNVYTSFQAIDDRKISAFLDNHPEIYKKLNYQFEVGSTHELINKPNTLGLTEFQNKGYGRRNKVWLSPMAGGLPISLSHLFNLKLHEFNGFSLAIGITLTKFLNRLTADNYKIKWPNDIYGNQGKAAGILIQAFPMSEHTLVKIGIGINWSLTPNQLSQVEYDAMNINSKKLNKTDFICLLVEELEKTFKEFESNGLKNHVELWNDFDFLIGKKVKISESNKMYTGINQGIDQEGNLKVLINGKTKVFTNGEVSLRKVDF